MSRGELASLGYTDGHLLELYEKHMGVRPRLDDDDTEDVQRARRRFFDEAMGRAYGGAYANPNGPKISSFAKDNADLHFGLQKPFRL